MPVQNVQMTVPPSDLNADEMSLQRNYALAQALQQNALQSPANESVSGLVVKQSPLQGLARMLQLYAGQKMQDRADEQQKRLVSAQQQKLAATLQAFGQETDPQKRAMILATSGHPELMKSGVAMMDQMNKPMVVGRTLMNSRGDTLGVDTTWQGEQEAARKQRELESSAKREDQKQMQADRLAMQQQIAAQASADRRMIAGMVNARQEQKNTPKLPTAALKMQQEELDSIATSGAINADLGALKDQIDQGKLPLGPMNNMFAKARNAMGVSSPESQNFASFQSTLEKLRNDSLRLNKGVQTEGDAQRAWNELVANINDPKVVSKRLAEIQAINERAATIRKMNVDNIRQNFGVEAMDVGGYQKQPAAVGGKPSNIDDLLKKYGG